VGVRFEQEPIDVKWETNEYEVFEIVTNEIDKK
jgi:hypothetical protein